jgi:hypothetical protein
MFNIYKSEYKDPLLEHKYVADPNRQVTLQRVAGLAHRPGAAFKMTVGEAVIPFEATGDVSTDPEPGKSSSSDSLTLSERARLPNFWDRLSHTSSLTRRQRRNPSCLRQRR